MHLLQAESPPPILVATKKASTASKKKAIKESSIEDEEDLLEEKLVEFEVEAGDSEQTLETAACDGPVRFQRILNPILSDKGETEEDESVDVVSDDAGSNPGGGGGEPFKNFVPKNEKDGATYKCLFCNHIFKSHYCYQKHKRRHLNPFMVDYTITSTVPPQQQQQKKIVPSTSPTNPNLPLKDINVQFFPCKICGAKFPSYYFVHKHKKIWHPESVTNSGETLKKSMDQ